MPNFRAIHPRLILYFQSDILALPPEENSGKVGGQAVLGRQIKSSTPWLTERHGYDPT